MKVVPSDEQALGPFYTPAEERMAAEITRLRARVAELERVGTALRDDMLFRARVKMDVIHGEEHRIVNAGNGAWTAFCAALKGDTHG